MGDRPSSKDCAKACRVDPGAPFSLRDFDPGDERFFKDVDEAKESWREDSEEIDKLQDKLFAEGKRALLVVLQGIDCAGKGGTIRRVFNSTGPRGVRVAAFGKPTDRELSHDYLWRVHQVVPPRGFIGVFDRSHYEDVLIVKVRELAPADAVEKRYDQINAFEKHLVENDVVILKFMLHMSKDEQARRLQDRLDTPKKRWKFNPSDLEERKLWDEYADAYEEALQRCSTKHAPWFVVPSDNKERRSAIVARIVRGALEDMDPQYPDPGFRPEDYVVA